MKKFVIINEDNIESANLFMGYRDYLLSKEENYEIIVFFRAGKDKEDTIDQIKTLHHIDKIESIEKEVVFKKKGGASVKDHRD
ncbi:MAG: hypothetical protein PF572_03840 [Patescibacteria group bacterium]|jgi:hypothetical protein|nr:hypothetical protein [Patescibacteria group bacterium]